MALGFYFDMQRCIGCRTCQVACKERRNIQKAGARPRRVASFETGTYPEAGMFHSTIGCNHCEHPACVANCPTAAMYKNADGIVLHDDSRCVQCRNCMTVCPYGAPQWDAEASVIVKCDSCLDLRKAGGNPACVDACPMRALEFGDIDQLKAKHGAGLVDELPYLPSASYTTPNLLIQPNAAAKSAAFNEVTL